MFPRFSSASTESTPCNEKSIMSKSVLGPLPSGLKLIPVRSSVEASVEVMGGTYRGTLTGQGDGHDIHGQDMEIR